jgi:hypothetical protein
MRTFLLAVLIFSGSTCLAQTIEKPVLLPANAISFPPNKWCTMDKKVLCYRGDSLHIQEYAWVLIHEADGNYWQQEEDDVRNADEYVDLGDEFEFYAGVWNLSTGKRLVMIHYPKSPHAALFLCPKGYKDIASLVK